MVDHTATDRAPRQRAWTLAAALLACCIAQPAGAVQVQDLVRIKGAEASKLVGMGLVVGLNGTGDGKNMRNAQRQLAAMMTRLGDPLVTPQELADAKNIAVVYLSATVQPGGVREGDRIDVQLAAPSATSLEGGRLVISPLLGPLPNSPIFAYAEGAIVVESADSPATAVVRGGAQLTRDLFARYLDDYGRLTLVLEQPNATWPMATTLASLVNDLLAPDAPPIAQAIDQKNVIVQVPQADRHNPGPFISQLLEIQIDSSLVRSEARVRVNRRTGTIVITENVELSPVVIAHKNLEITTITPEPQPDPLNPRVETNPFVALDPSGHGRNRLADLLSAFNQLKVPAADQIDILEQIHRSGKLHAQLIIED